MVMTLPERHEGLRPIADDLDRYEGYRIEIIGGVLMMSPSPRIKHSRTLTKVQRQFEEKLPAELIVDDSISVTSPETGDDYVEPDLMVFPASYEDTEAWAVPAFDVEFVVEVVSVSNATRDTVDKVAWYAKAQVPKYFLIDPREGEWRLYSEPVEGEYQVVRHGKYGQDVVLPTPFDFKLRTDEFKRYDS